MHHTAKRTSSVIVAVAIGLLSCGCDPVPYPVHMTLDIQHAENRVVDVSVKREPGKVVRKVTCARGTLVDPDTGKALRLETNRDVWVDYFSGKEPRGVHYRIKISEGEATQVVDVALDACPIRPGGSWIQLAIPERITDARLDPSVPLPMRPVVIREAPQYP